MIDRKKKMLLINALSGALALTAGGVLWMQGKDAFKILPTAADETSYTLNVAAEADLGAVKTSNGNAIAFNGIGYTTGSFTSGGIVGNTTALSGLKGIALSITSGAFDLYKSWDGTNYYDLALTLNATTNAYAFTDAPSYLKIVATEASVITGFSIVYSCAKSDISSTFLAFPVGYGTKVYDASAATLPYVPSGVVASWEDSSKAALSTAPSAAGSYYVKITNGIDTLEKAYAITDYTTDVFAEQPGIKVTMTSDGVPGLTKGSNGEMIFTGWWAYLVLDTVYVPAGATSMVLHMKSSVALTNTEYNYSYPGHSLGYGNISIGTDYSDITVPCASNACNLTALNILAQGATITISSISFTIPTPSVPTGKTGIFAHLGTDYPAVTSKAFRDSPACTFYNNADDGALAFGGQWWDNVLFNGATGVTIPSGKTTMTLSMKGSVAFNCLYVFSGSPVNFVYDESVGFAITADYQDFTVDLHSATMVNSFGFCTCNNTVFIQSVTFA